MSSGDKRGPEIGSGHDSGPFKRSRAPDTPLLDHQLSLDEYTVGCVCAHDFEMAAVEGMLEKLHPQPAQQDPNDHNSYILGEVWGHNVVIACLPDGIHGTTTAATVAKDMLRTFESIRFGLMVGVGGGIPSKDHDIRLGDIVVSRPSGTNGGVVQYDLGKALQEGRFQRTGSLNAPPQVLLAALTQLRAKHLMAESRVPAFLEIFHSKLPQKKRPAFAYPGTSKDCLFLADYSHGDPDLACDDQCDPTRSVSREGRGDTVPAIHYGTIASGNEVIKDSKKRDEIGKELGALCLEMEAAGLQDFPCIVIRGICDYADSHKNNIWQLYAAAAAAAFAKELLSIIPPSQVLQENPIPQLVSLASESLNVSKQHLDMLSRTFGEQRRTNKILEARAIDLYVVYEACYNSEDVGSSPRCEANTRVRIQQSIKQWADDETGESFLWLVGPAGTGKSTLIRSVADSFYEANRLVAGYFFKRGEQGRNDTNRLFSTLAIQLADAIPSFKDNLRVSVSDTDKDSIDKMDLAFQFKKLIKTPVRDLRPSDADEAPRIIVLDALDECERLENLPRVLALMSDICNESAKYGLRVLLTSRPDPRIISAFGPLIQDGVARKLELHRMFFEDTEDDIRLYLKTNFMRIKIKANIQQDPWPSVAEVDRLVELSTNPEPLFIYAATLLRFVYDENHLQNPKNQLKIWIRQCENNKSQLHQMYNPILEQIFAFGKDTDFDQQLKFLGALVLTTLPLSLTSLTSLLALDIDDVNWWLPSLHAVLDIPSDSHKPLRLHHKSFSDFLLSEENPGHDRFRLDSREIHALLADRCIELMGTELKRDICHLKTLDATPQDVDKNLLARCIPLELQYSCRYWVYHLRASGEFAFNQILAFLLEHFLHWLEVSALLSQTSDALEALRDLFDLFKVRSYDGNLNLLRLLQSPSETSSELFDFLNDAIRTVSNFASIIERAPLQTYASLLLFSPVASRVRQRLWDQRLPRLSHIEGVKPNWDAHLQTIEVPNNVKTLVFSPNGKFLASVDNTVRLWNASTGVHLITFAQSSFLPVKVIFFPSSQLLAIVSSWGLVSIWDTTTLIHLQKISCSDMMSRITSLAISSDDKALILKQYSGQVELWHMCVGAKRFNLMSTFNMMSHVYVAASAKGLEEAQSQHMRLLVNLAAECFRTTGTLCYLIAISSGLPLMAGCDKGDGSCHKILLLGGTPPTTNLLMTDGRLVNTITFSPNGKLLVASCEGVVLLWDTTTYKRTCILEDSDNSYTVSFSPNDQFLVLDSQDRTRFWNTVTGDYRDVKLRHQNAIAISSDGQTLATASGAAIKLWDLGYLDFEHRESPFATDIGTPGNLLLSPNGRVVIPGLSCDTTQPCDSITGERLGSPTNEMETSRDRTEGPIIKPPVRVMPCHIAFSAEGQLAATLYSGNGRTSSNTLQFFDATTGREAYTLNLAAQLQAMAFFQDVRLYDATGHPITVEHTAQMESMAFSPNGQILALSLGGGTIQLWNTKARTLQRIIRQFHKVSPSTLVFSPNGEMLASMSNEIVWWDVATGIRQNTIHPGFGPFHSSAFSPDLSLLGAVHVQDGSLWEVFTLYHIKTTEDTQILRGHEGNVVQIIFSPDSSMVALASDDRMVRLWDTMTYRHFRSFMTSDVPEMTRFSHDGSTMAATSKRRSIRLWDVTTGSLLQMIHLDGGFIQELMILPDQVSVWVFGAEGYKWGEPLDTDAFRLSKLSCPRIPNSQTLTSQGLYRGITLDLHECWVMEGPEKLISIPPEYRPVEIQSPYAGEDRWSRRGHALSVACSNGQVICLSCS